MYKCRKVLVGGTFSLLHRGHRHLLAKALSLGRHIVVGITSDEYIRHLSKPHPVEPYDFRALAVLLYILPHMNEDQVVEIVPLDDIYGPALDDPSADCIVVSEETLLSAVKINIGRRIKGLKPLKIICVETISIAGERISSTLIWRLLTEIPGA